MTHILFTTTWRSYTFFKSRRELFSKPLTHVKERPLSLLTAHRPYFKILVKQKLLSPLHMKLEITIEASWYWRSNQFCWQINRRINLLCVIEHPSTCYENHGLLVEDCHLIHGVGVTRPWPCSMSLIGVLSIIASALHHSWQHHPIPLVLSWAPHHHPDISSAWSRSLQIFATVTGGGDEASCGSLHKLKLWIHPILIPLL